MSLKTLLTSTTIAISLISGAMAQARVNDEETSITTFTTLSNMVAATLVWNLHSDTSEQNRALQAFLSAKVNSGTSEISTRESMDFRTINAVSIQVSATPDHLLLTVQSPAETFDSAVEHINKLLREPGINENWLKRQSRAFDFVSSARLRTPELLESELVEYAQFAGDGPAMTGTGLQTEILRRPNQILLNGKDFDFGDTPNKLLDGIFSIDARLNDVPPTKRRALPTGTIHLPDAEATETLIFMGRIQEFETETQQAQSDTLYRYMGYGPGSEMFRIVRQEKRASYDPVSHFRQIDERVAITGLSATVPAEIWPEIHNVIAQIYDDVRAGDNSVQGLEDSHDLMLNIMIGDLRRDPDWLAKRYLELYPNEPPKGRINLDLINASFDIEPADLNKHAKDVLPPRDDMITVIIGGTITPSADMRANGYCELPKGEALAFCLDKLATE